MEATDRLPASVFPSQPDKDGLCLTCRTVKRKRHSWFCCVNCECLFLEEVQRDMELVT